MQFFELEVRHGQSPLNTFSQTTMGGPKSPYIWNVFSQTATFGVMPLELYICQ